MNIKKILTLVIFMTTLIVNAQIKLTGVVKDSIGPLEMANVIALDTVSKKIVSSHVNRKNLLEIGPGIGALTKYLIKETNTFLVIEIDDDCVDYLKKEFDNINLIKEDILKVDFL